MPDIPISKWRHIYALRSFQSFQKQEDHLLTEKSGSRKWKWEESPDLQCIPGTEDSFPAICQHIRWGKTSATSSRIDNPKIQYPSRIMHKIILLPWNTYCSEPHRKTHSKNKTMGCNMTKCTPYEKKLNNASETCHAFHTAIDLLLHELLSQI